MNALTPGHWTISMPHPFRSRERGESLDRGVLKPRPILIKHKLFTPPNYVLARDIFWAKRLYLLEVSKHIMKEVERCCVFFKFSKSNILTNITHPSWHRTRISSQRKYGHSREQLSRLCAQLGRETAFCKDRAMLHNYLQCQPTR